MFISWYQIQGRILKRACPEQNPHLTKKKKSVVFSTDKVIGRLSNLKTVNDETEFDNLGKLK